MLFLSKAVFQSNIRQRRWCSQIDKIIIIDIFVVVVIKIKIEIEIKIWICEEEDEKQFIVFLVGSVTVIVVITGFE